MRALPDWSASLRQLYWQLRWCRVYRYSEVRKSYRRIKRERRRLVAAGVDGEAVRLLCRYLSNPRCEIRESRFWSVVDAQVPSVVDSASAHIGGMGAKRPI